MTHEEPTRLDAQAPALAAAFAVAPVEARRRAVLVAARAAAASLERRPAAIDEALAVLAASADLVPDERARASDVLERLAVEHDDRYLTIRGDEPGALSAESAQLFRLARLCTSLALALAGDDLLADALHEVLHSVELRPSLGDEVLDLLQRA